LRKYIKTVTHIHQPNAQLYYNLKLKTTYSLSQ
jgi:hypothetical protein